MGATQRSLCVCGFLFFLVRREGAALTEQCGSQWHENYTRWKRRSEDEFRKEEESVAAERYVTYLHKILLSICRYYRVLHGSV